MPLSSATTLKRSSNNVKSISMKQNRTYSLNLFALSLLLFGFVSTSIASDEGKEAQRLLERMMHSVNSLNYQGTFIYMHDGQLELMEILHAVHGDIVQERLVSLNGAPREIIRNSASVTCIMPEIGRVSVDYRPENRGFSLIGTVNPEELTDRYRFSISGRARIAGRMTDVVAIIPRDTYRYGYRLYLDEESGLPLKSDLMDEQGKPLEQIMFTSLEISPAIPSQEGTLSTAQAAPEISQKPRGGVEKSRWSFQSLPMGFVLTTYTSLPDREGAEHMVLSDGLASISIFVEKIAGNQVLDGASRMGAVNAWGGQIAGYQVTAVGEVPAVTVKQVAQMMVLSDPVGVKHD